jgi:hypothetical protein
MPKREIVFVNKTNWLGGFGVLAGFDTDPASSRLVSELVDNEIK